jgi:hypothetical protein
MTGPRPRPSGLLARFNRASQSDRSAVVALVTAAILALVIVSPGVGSHAPGDPSAFAGDARFDRCGGGTVPTRYAFEMEQARDYRDHLPAMPRTSELELDDPALVVVFEGRGPFVSRPTLPPGASGTQPPAPTAPPGRHDVCIYVGQAGRGELNYYREVAIAGLRVTLDGPVIESPDVDGTT